MPTSLTILGCGSAKPTKQLSPSSQLLDMRDKQFLIDCGEGTQIAMQRIGARQNRLNNIFISHLHGDHCLGLIGLLSTWGMLGRTRSITIHAHPDLERLLKPQLDYFCQDLSYDVIFHHINPRKQEVVYEDRTIRVTSLPLKHRVPCCGFLFEEIRRKPPMLQEGEPLPVPFRYAYCTDTAYSEKLIEMIQGVDCIYHDATYSNQWQQLAKKYYHSTAAEAATIAQKAGVKKLILGHFSARISDFDALLAEATSIFPNTLLAKEQTTFVL